MATQLVLKTAPAVEPISLLEVIRQLRLDIITPEISSGALTVGNYYQITATEEDHFYTDCVVYDIFQATTAIALDSDNKVREVTEGAYLNSLITGARKYAEDVCGPLITQSWYQYQEDWPAGSRLSIYKPHLISVVAVKYTKYGETAATTFSSTNYIVDAKDGWRPGIVLYDDCSWPSDSLLEVNPIEIEFTCGYGASGSSVPQVIRDFMLVHIALCYFNRMPTEASEKSLNLAADRLLINYRARWTDYDN